MDADERVKMIEELKKILQKELMMIHADVPEMVSYIKSGPLIR